MNIIIPDAEDFGFVEKKYTEYEKKVIIGANNLIFEIYVYLPDSSFYPCASLIKFAENFNNEKFEETVLSGKSLVLLNIHPLNKDIPAEEWHIPFMILRTAEYINSSDKFDSSNIEILYEAKYEEYAISAKNELKSLNIKKLAD